MVRCIDSQRRPTARHLIEIALGIFQSLHVQLQVEVESIVVYTIVREDGQ